LFLLANPQQSRAYDVLMRLPMLMWSIFLGLVTLVGLQQYIGQADPALPSAVYTLNIAMRLSVILYLSSSPPLLWCGCGRQGRRAVSSRGCPR
jgi:hypothetical protein